MPVVLDRRRKNGTSVTKLTDKQRILANEYLANGLNASKAAKIAGYKNPGRMGTRIVNLPIVKKYIQAKGTKLLEVKELRAEDIIEQLTRILKFNVMKAFRSGGEGGFMEITEEQYDAVAEAIGDCVTEVRTDTKKKFVARPDGTEVEQTEIKFLLKFMSKEKAIEILARYFGLVSDKVEHHQTVNINWNDMFIPEKNREDPIEQQLLEVEARAAQIGDSEL